MSDVGQEAGARVTHGLTARCGRGRRCAQRRRSAQRNAGRDVAAQRVTEITTPSLSAADARTRLRWRIEFVLPYCWHASRALDHLVPAATMLRRFFPGARGSRWLRLARAHVGQLLAVSRQREYVIAMYVGDEPWALSPHPAARRPILTRRAVSDVPAAYVADPFILHHEGSWYMFFEVLRSDSGRGEIAVARSEDLLRWSYIGVVLAEPMHLSYPHVFAHDGTVYMVPESHEASSVRLYRARDFPMRWEFVGSLVDGKPFVDASLVLHHGHWYMFVGTIPHGGFTSQSLHLYHADVLEGPWLEHGSSPLIRDDPRMARPAGRVIEHESVLVRYVQDCETTYGYRVFAITIESLTPTDYRERQLGDEPVVGPGPFPWNSGGMHHVDAHRLDGTWFAAVDGWALRFARSRR